MVLKPKKKNKDAANEGPAGSGGGAASSGGGRSSQRKSKQKKWADVDPGELKAYKKLFKEIDTDGSGGIDKKELRRAMRKRTMKISEEKINEVFEEVDKNRDDLLDLDEFIAGMLSFKPKELGDDKAGLKSGLVWFRREGLRSRLSDDQLKFYKDAFGTMDEAGKGSVNAQQFYELIKFLGVETNLKTVKKLVAGQDHDGKGEIDFDGFLEMISRSGDGEGLRQSAQGLGAWKQWFKEDVQRTISAIQAKEADEAAQKERKEVALAAVRAVLSQEQMDGFKIQYDGLLEHGKAGRAGLDVAALAYGLVEEAGLEKKDAKREAKVLVANAALDYEKSVVCWEAFLHAMATKKEGWNWWWRGDRTVKMTKSFDASGGSGLLGAIADTTKQVSDNESASILKEEDAREESALVAKMKRLRAKRERENAPPREEGDEERLTPKQSPRRLPPILQQLQNAAVYSDDDLSPRSELLAGVRKFLYDKCAATENDAAGETDTARMVAAGRASTTTLGVALDTRSNFLYGKAYCPGPPSDFSAEDPACGPAFLFKAGLVKKKPGVDAGQAGVDAALAAVGRKSTFGLAPTQEAEDEDADEDAADDGGDGEGGAEDRDTPLDNFREKMKRDLVLIMAYTAHMGSLPANLKKCYKHLALFEWPSMLDWTGVIDEMKEEGTVFCAVDSKNKPYEIYF